MNKEQILEKLISFKTISETDNNQIIDFIINFLKKYNIKEKKNYWRKGQI